MKKHWLLFSLVTLTFLGGLFIRLYRLPQLMNFSMEQTWALSLTGDMINNRKLALIATPYISRETNSHHYFYQAGTYLYPIAPLYILFHGDPLPITAVFAVLNILSGLGLFFVTKKFFGAPTAIFTFILFAFNFVLVDYSRLIWHVPLLIPVVVGLIYLFLDYLKTPKTISALWLGFLVGLGWGIHVSLIVIGGLLLGYFVFQAFKRKIFALPILYVLGGLVGILPLIVFDIRHEFFNLRVLWEFVVGLFTHTNKASFFFTNYHLVHLIPIVCILVGWLLAKLFRYHRLISMIIIFSYLLFNFPNWRLKAQTPLGLPEGWNISGMKKVSQIIANDASGKFEVAQIIEGETPASTIRYFLDYTYRVHPLSANDYPYADSLYVIGRSNQDPVTYNVWEINSIKPVKIAKSWPIQGDYLLYKLLKDDRSSGYTKYK